MDFLSNVISGLSLGSIYALIALGYTMVYGIAKMLNFAHGDVIMVGAYVVFYATASAGIPALPAVLISIVVCTTLGVVIERVGNDFLCCSFKRAWNRVVFMNENFA